MLTRELGICAVDFDTGTVIPDRLLQGRHAHYPALAERMLDLYRQGVGRCRCDLHAAVERLFADDPDFHERRVAAFCKLLDDVSDFDTDRRGARKLRSRVFSAGALAHPLVRQENDLFEKTESAVKAAMEIELKMPWREIADALFADVIDFHRLRRFDGYPDPRSLLARYNVAQVQTALFDAVRLHVDAGGDYKRILRFAKLARLMHTIRRKPDGTYRFLFDGPVSALAETRRYGALMARFIPGLLSCRGWTLKADIRRKNWSRVFRLNLSPEDGLTAPAPPAADFDSSVEEAFAAAWGNEPRAGWRLERETEILHEGQHCFFPDFVFVQESGRRVLLEVVGFWTEAYLAAKRETLRRFPNARILLAVKAPLTEAFHADGAWVVEFKTALKPEVVLAALEQGRGT